MRTSRHLVPLVVLALAAAACSSDSASPGPTTTVAPAATTTATTAVAETSTTVESSKYAATIRRTKDDVAHITAADLGGVFFGQGWASAEDRACDLADQVLKVKGEKAKWLGPGDDTNPTKWVDADFAWRAIGIDKLARADYPNAPQKVRDQFEAFAAGWSAAVRKEGVPGWCKGQPWVTPLTGIDVYAYARSIALNASSSRLTAYLGKASPPAAPGSPTTSEQSLAAMDEPAEASNGWAFGRDTTAGGGGMLLSNPHFPWVGELRFWEVQLTVPGQMDIYGVQLGGVPGVGIGFTEAFGWTHTVSAGNRFTAYLLTLKAGAPTTYVVDGQDHAMTSREETVDVLQPDGSTKPEKRTLWFSDVGPILDFPGVGWNDKTVITYRDANIQNDEFLELYAAMDTAQSFDEFLAALEKYQAVPLFNTIATSKDGRAWYGDISATPALSKEAQAAYDEALKTDFFTQAAAGSGAVLLDGSKSLNDWVDKPGARDPGLEPYSELPKVERSDHVFNANDSFWVVNANATLDGDYSILHGRKNTARSVRTRENAVVLRTLTSSPVTIDALKDAALANRGYTSRELLHDVVARCHGKTVVDVPELAAADGSVALPAEAVDVSTACGVLGSWDGTYELDSKGAIVWREMITRFESKDLMASGPLWAEPFDLARPLDTPSGLAPPPAGAADPVLVNLARAVQITKAGFTLDAALGDVQRADRNGTMVPVHGGTNTDGATNIVGYGRALSTSEPVPVRGPTFAPRSTLTAAGYPVDNGTSFLMALAYGSDGPQAWTFLTYGNSGDPAAPVFTQSTQQFSEKGWKEVAFTEADIAVGTESTEAVSGD
jgi:acyl-homoserine-lactone acylase